MIDELRKALKAIAKNVDLDILERLPFSKLHDVKDLMKVMERFGDCGHRVASEKVSHVTPVDLKKIMECIQVIWLDLASGYDMVGSGKSILLNQLCRAHSCDEADNVFYLFLYFLLRDLQSLLRGNKCLDHIVLAQPMMESNGRDMLMAFNGTGELMDLLYLQLAFIYMKPLMKANLYMYHTEYP